MRHKCHRQTDDATVNGTMLEDASSMVVVVVIVANGLLSTFKSKKCMLAKEKAGFTEG